MCLAAGSIWGLSPSLLVRDESTKTPAVRSCLDKKQRRDLEGKKLMKLNWTPGQGGPSVEAFLFFSFFLFPLSGCELKPRCPKARKKNVISSEKNSVEMSRGPQNETLLCNTCFQASSCTGEGGHGGGLDEDGGAQLACEQQHCT